MDELETNKLPQELGKRNLTREEQSKLDNWYAAFDVSGKDLSVFRNSEHEEKVRVRLLGKIIAQIPEEKKSSSLGFLFSNHYNWMKVAAVLAFFIISIPLNNYVNTINDQPLAELSVLKISQAQVGQVLKLRLSDGSEVWLNAGAVFKYPVEFGEQMREVYLEGEAFFNIAPNPAKPFVVNTGAVKTVVLGTSFNIKAYPSIEHINVAVATGKVGIVASDKTLSVLEADQQISVDTRTGTFEVTEINARLATSWQKGRIRLDGVTFKELALVIKNTWGYTLIVQNDRLAEAKFKTTFYTNNKIEDVMKTISKMTNAKYRIKDKIITLYE